MAIVRLKKVILFGSLKNKEKVLRKLQEFGKVHVVFEKEGVSAGNKKLGKLGEIQEAIAYLELCPKQFPEAKYTSSVIADEIIERVEEMKDLKKRGVKLNNAWGLLDEL